MSVVLVSDAGSEVALAAIRAGATDIVHPGAEPLEHREPVGDGPRDLGVEAVGVQVGRYTDAQPPDAAAEGDLPEPVKDL